MGDPYAALADPVDAPPVAANDPYSAVADPADAPTFTPEERSRIIAFAKTARSGRELADFASNIGRDRGLGLDNADDIIKARNSGAGLNPNFLEPGSPPPPPPPPDTGFTHDLGVAGRGVADGLIDLGNMASKWLPGGTGPLDLVFGQRSPGDDAHRLLDSIPGGQPQTPGQHFLYSAARGAGAAGPFGLEGGTAGALTALGSGASSGLGGEAAKQAGYGPGVQFLASLAAGGGFAAAANGTRALTSIATAPRNSELLDAAARQGVTLNAADVNPGLRNANAYLEASPGSHGPIRANMNEGTGQMEQRVEALAPGTPQDPVGIGSRIQTAARRFIDASRNTKNALYQRAENLAGDQTISPAQTLAAIDQHIAQLSETPAANAGELKVLNAVRSDLVDAAGNPKNISVSALRNVRSSVRSLGDQATLAPDRMDAIANNVARGATGDITSQLAASNPRAAAAYATADAFHGQRQDMIREVVSRFLGPRNNPLSPEKALGVMKSMAKGVGGDDERMGRMLDTLEPDEHADLAATLADGLGRRSPEEPFSPGLFVSQVRQLSPQARERLFGKDGAAAIDDLITIGVAKRGTAAALNNSRSGMIGNYRDTLRATIGSLAGGGAGYAVGGPLGGAMGVAAPAAGGMVARNAAAKLFTNPAFVRWVARAPRTSGPAAIQSHIGKLSTVAASQPQIANEVQALQGRLSEAFGQGTLKAAASPRDQKQDAGSAPIEEN